MSWKRALYLFHRWAGIVLCLFFALWFVSGIFMMYVEFPELTKPERVAGSRLLDFSTARIDVAGAIAKLAPRDFTTRGTLRGVESLPFDPTATSIGTPRSMRLTMILGRPAYVIHADNGSQPRVVFADDQQQAWLAADLNGESGAIYKLDKVGGEWSRTARCAGWVKAVD